MHLHALFMKPDLRPWPPSSPHQFFTRQDMSQDADRRPGFAVDIERNSRTYQKLMAEAADRLMPPPDVSAASVKPDVYDILSEHVSRAVNNAVGLPYWAAFRGRALRWNATPATAGWRGREERLQCRLQMTAFGPPPLA